MLDLAISDFTEAIRWDRSSKFAYANRGESHRLNGNLIQAIKDTDMPVQLAPSVVRPYVVRAEMKRFVGEYAEALAEYSAALNLEADSISALSGEGLTYERLGWVENARDAFERALASRNRLTSTYNRDYLETARSRLAAINSGQMIPVIAPAPRIAKNRTSIPTFHATIPTNAGSRQSTPSHLRRVALVVGNSIYKSVPVLLNPVRDAGAIVNSLRSIGFQTVTLKSNTTREDKCLECFFCRGSESR